MTQSFECCFSLPNLWCVAVLISFVYSIQFGVDFWCGCFVWSIVIGHLWDKIGRKKAIYDNINVEKYWKGDWHNLFFLEPCWLRRSTQCFYFTVKCWQIDTVCTCEERKVNAKSMPFCYSISKCQTCTKTKFWETQGRIQFRLHGVVENAQKSIMGSTQMEW